MKNWKTNETSQLSHGQKALWYINQLSPNTGCYNINYSWRVSPSFNIEGITKTIRILLNRHPALRTQYIEKEGIPFQKIVASVLPDLEVIDAQNWDNIKIEHFLREETLHPFDLSSNPFFRWKVLNISNHEDILCITGPHISSDLWSHIQLIAEFKTIYNGIIKGETQHYPSSSKNYSDFIQKQSAYIKSEKAAQDWLYWKEQLSGDLTEIDLPFDKPRPSRTNFDFVTHETSLTKAMSKSLGNLAFRNSTSPYTLFLTAFSVLLSRLSHQDNIVTGSPVAGRNQKEFGDIIGYFVNTVVIKNDLSGNPSFLELLKQTGETVKEARQHQDYPFPLLVEKLHPPRDRTYSPLFNVLFAWEDPNSFLSNSDKLITIKDGEEIWNMGNFSMKLVQKAVVSNFDLSLQIRNVSGLLTVIWSYNPELFNLSTIKRISGYFDELLNSILVNPHTLIDDISIIPLKERESVLFTWNNTTVQNDLNLNFVDLFQKVAQDHQNEIAISHQVRNISYEELNSKANQVARYIESLGTYPEMIIGICLDRSIEMVVSILGIMKSGCAYIPLDPEYPQERLDYMVKDSNLSVVLTNRKYSKILPERITKPIFLDDFENEIGKLDTSNPQISISASSLAYVIYTSGSTGLPKGVLLEHRGLCNVVNSQKRLFDLKTGDRILQFASFNFDVSLLEIVMAIGTGATLYLTDKKRIFPGPELAKYLVNKKISNLLITPSALTLLSDFHFPALKTVIVGGEPCPISLAQKWYKRYNLYNEYGPTETTILSSIYHIRSLDVPINIGKPIPNTQIYILDKSLKPVPIGVRGEIYIGGIGIAREYLNKPDLTAERFIANPFSGDSSARLYKTGDLARYLENGNIEYLGRIDFQVKIRGHRIETGEIESVINQHPQVDNSVVTVDEDKFGNKQLVAYIIPQKGAVIDQIKIITFLKSKLPTYMLPSVVIPIEQFPMTHNGKIDLQSLPKSFHQPRLAIQNESWESASQLEREMFSIWEEVLNHSQFGIDDNFFDIGGNSLLMLEAFNQLPDRIRDNIEFVDQFEHPTIRSLSVFLQQNLIKNNHQDNSYPEAKKVNHKTEIAVIGMSGRFPGAPSVDELWQNLINGVESISHFSEEELLFSGMDHDLIQQPSFVKSKGVMQDLDLFDSRFFGFSPKQADMTDPQHRVFLECSWEALENAGYDPARYYGQIGIYGGSGCNNYRDGLIDAQSGMISTGDFPIMIGNEKDFLCTRVAYKLNLKGPAVVNQSACSTSLVAVHSACQALKNYECDMALAGGVSIIGSDYGGYIFQKGGILSPDGHCRPFDAQAQGTVPGQGVGLVVLKRLEDALQEGDTILAVIKGSAINNDGSLKAGYTAPSVDGQMKVIKAALNNANVDASSISYIETHGTGTPLGDPIEIRALTKAYGMDIQKKPFCALGAVKSNLGHLDTAAGVTGLIKTILSIKNRQLTPIANFESPNPAINFESSPFFITDRLMDWDAGDYPLRAGVSSFGIGGTNAHVIVEEPPSQKANTKSENWQLLPLSAKSPSALNKACENLLDYLETSSKNQFDRLPNIAYTLQVGRQEFHHRCIITCKNTEDAIQSLKLRDPSKIAFSKTTASNRPVAFMFPGQGSQYVNMAKELYFKEPIFTKEMDICFTYLLKQKALDIKSILFPTVENLQTASIQINQSLYTQPILFSIEYALAKLWMSYGIQPKTMIGHSIGEYAAACISGVFSLEDTLLLVCERARLIQSLPYGDMLSIRMSEKEILPLLNDCLSIAAVNTHDRCVISGEHNAIKCLKGQLEKLGKDCHILHTSHAFHSRMLDPILKPFREFISNLTFNQPQISYISNVTGEWIRKDQAVDPEYWVSHLRGSVQFSKGIKQILKNPDVVLLEVGPGRVLSTLSSQNLTKTKANVVVSSVSPPDSKHSDLNYMLSSLGKLWLHGVKVNWEQRCEQSKRLRIPLPTYPFEKRRHWQEIDNKPHTSSNKNPNIGDWFYLPTWKQAYHEDRFNEELELTDGMNWLVFTDNQGMGIEVAEILRSHDQRVFEVKIGKGFKQLNKEQFVIKPKNRSDFEQLVALFEEQNFVPEKIIHMWTVTGSEHWGLEYFNYLQTIGLSSIITLLQILEQKKIRKRIQLQIVTDNAQEVTGAEPLSPGKSTLMALVNGIQQEYHHIFCQTVDIAISDSNKIEKKQLALRLIKEIKKYGSDQIIAYRKEYRWIQAFEKRYLEPQSQNTIQLKGNGVYLITGGLGNIGLIMAEYLSTKIRAKIALVGRSAFPPRADWQHWLDSNDSSNVISVKIERLMQLERMGSEIQVYQADISEFKQTKKAVDNIEDTFGPINGIFHIAGEIGLNTLQRISKITPEILDRQFKPKVYGAFVLEKLFKDKQLSFAIMFSSLSSVTGGVEYTAYSAANLFLDSFAKLMDKFSPNRWITINWDGWKTSENLKSDFLINPEEGAEVINRILSQNLITQLIISTTDLFNRLNQRKPKQTNSFSERVPEPHTNLAITSSDQEESYVPPRNDIELRLVKIWEEFLGIERISIHDDFFEIGGDSLMAIRLTARLEESFPQAVTEKTILQESTVCDLALAIQNNLESQSKDSQEQRLAKYKSLIQIQKGSDSKRPLFLVHTGLGFVYYYIDLAKSLGKTQPVYAFQAMGLKKGTEPMSSIPKMATVYVDELLNFKPIGPYFLGGSSAGGFIAFEMAKQLQERGHQVSLLTMIDTPGPISELPRPIQDNMEIVSRMFGDKLDLDNLAADLRDMPLDSLIHYIVDQVNKNNSSNDLTYGFVESSIRVAKMLEKAMFDYSPESYSGKILFFKHSEPLEEFSHFPERPWIDLADQGVHIIKAPGNHYTMNMNPNVSFIANQIKIRMEKTK